LSEGELQPFELSAVDVAAADRVADEITGDELVETSAEAVCRKGEPAPYECLVRNRSTAYLAGSRLAAAPARRQRSPLARKYVSMTYGQGITTRQITTPTVQSTSVCAWPASS
jgi:hypothetical protein